MARVSESGHGVLPPPLPEQLSGHNLYSTSRRLRGLVRVRTRPPAGSDRVRSIRVSASFHRVLSILAKGAYDLGGRFTSYCLPQFSGRRRALGTKKRRLIMVRLLLAEVRLVSVMSCARTVAYCSILFKTQWFRSLEL